MSMRILLRYKRILTAAILLLASMLILLHQIGYNVPARVDHQGRHSKPRVAILVPFRNRFDELLTFVPYMTKFLNKQDIGPFRIYILNQSNRYRFNRGALANVGYMLAKDQSEYIAIHDVDLIPVNVNLSYAFPEQGPYHLSAPEYHPNYNYDKYFGGILLINNKHFELVNGFSNRYFGWGLEDDEFYARVKAAKIPIFRPTNLNTNRNNTFLHFHHDRKRDKFRTKEQREVLRYRDRVTGLKDLRYLITSKRNLTIDGNYSCTVFNIELYCDTKQTPWCLPNQTKSKQTLSTQTLEQSD